MPNDGVATGVMGGGKIDLEGRDGEGEGADDFAGAACTWLFAFWRTPNTGGEADFPNRLPNGGAAGGALAALGGSIDGRGAGVAGVVEGFVLPNNRRGGVLGLRGGLLTDVLLDSSASGLSGDGGGIGKIAK